MPIPRWKFGPAIDEPIQPAPVEPTTGLKKGELVSEAAEQLPVVTGQIPLILGPFGVHYIETRVTAGRKGGVDLGFTPFRPRIEPEPREILTPLTPLGPTTPVFGEKITTIERERFEIVIREKQYITSKIPDIKFPEIKFPEMPQFPDVLGGLKDFGTKAVIILGTAAIGYLLLKGAIRKK